MTRRALVLLTVVLILLWATRFIVDGRSVPRREQPEGFEQIAARAFTEGRFAASAAAYRRAFHLLDPRDPRQTPRRAAVALRAGRAYARYVRDERPDRTNEDLEQVRRFAVRWLGEGLALDPGEAWAHVERGLLFDQVRPALREPAEARLAYAAFVSEAVDAPAQASLAATGVSRTWIEERLRELAR